MSRLSPVGRVHVIAISQSTRLAESTRQSGPTRSAKLSHLGKPGQLGSCNRPLTHHFANSAVCCRFLRFSPSNLASMIRKMPLFLLSIIRRISLIVLKEFRCFFDFKIVDVVEVLFWRNIATI